MNYNNLNQIYMNQREIDDQHLMSKLQELIPQLRREIESSFRNKLNAQLQKAKEDKRRQLSSQYQQKIMLKIEESNSLIKESLGNMVQTIETYKSHQKAKIKNMNKQEEDEFIEQTVEEILENEHMTDELRNRIRPKVEAKVKIAYDQELESGIERVRKDLVEKLNHDRQVWTEEKVQFWKRQSSLELQQLAEQHNELNSKKLSIEASLNAKKIEKSQLEQRLQMIMSKNAQVSDLRRQLKQLKEQALF